MRFATDRNGKSTRGVHKRLYNSACGGGVWVYLYVFMRGHVEKEPPERIGRRFDPGAEEVGQQEIQLLFVEVMADGVIVVPLRHFSHKHGHQIVTSVRGATPLLHQRFVYGMRVFHAFDHLENRFPVLRHRPETTRRDVCVLGAKRVRNAVLTSKTGARSAAWRRRISSIRPRPTAAGTSSSGRPPATLCPALCGSRNRRRTPGIDSWCRPDVGRTLEFSTETTTHGRVNGQVVFGGRARYRYGRRRGVHDDPLQVVFLLSEPGHAHGLEPVAHEFPLFLPEGAAREYQT